MQREYKHIIGYLVKGSIRRLIVLYSYVPRPTNYVTQDGSFVFFYDRMGRIISDVVRGMSVTQFIGVGHTAILLYPVFAAKVIVVLNNE